MENTILNQWFRSALEGSGVLAFVTDAKLKYLDAINTREGESFFIGKTPRELYSKIPGGLALCEDYDRVLATGDVVKTEIQIDGNWFEVLLRRTDLPNGSQGVLGIATDITVQKIALREQAHRTKNAFTMAMAMVNNTARGFGIPLEFKTKLHARLSALSQSQDAVDGGGGSSIQELIQSQIGHAIIAEPHRFDVSQTDCYIGANIAQYVALAFYELYTNAIKYGSLSNASGRVSIQIVCVDGRIGIVWAETGGPEPRDDPEGFGRKLVASIIPKATKGTAEFDLRPTGLVWSFNAPTNI